MLVVFLPVNAPLFLLAVEAMDITINSPDWFVGLSFFIFFIIGGILAFMPRISLPRLSLKMGPNHRFSQPNRD